MSEALQACFDGLVAEHGLVASTDLSIARAIARVMTADDADPVRAGESIVKLKALLPAKPPSAPAAAGYDLSKLSDAELAELARLTAIATGEAPPSPALEPDYQALHAAARTEVHILETECARLREMLRVRDAAAVMARAVARQNPEAAIKAAGDGAPTSERPANVVPLGNVARLGPPRDEDLPANCRPLHGPNQGSYVGAGLGHHRFDNQQ
jgi:hypothetical protein